MGYIDLPVSGGGITIYPNLAAFPASAPDGTQGVAADTNTIYIYNSSVPGWVAVATPPVGVYISDLTGDVTATGPGSAAATVAFVGGETAADVAISVQDTQAATDLSTPSTLVKRDASGQTSLDGLNLDGSTSGAISLQAANTTTSYTVKMPAAQGSASSVLQNDGSGNLSWSVLPTPVTSVTGSAPISSSGGTTPAISISQSSTTVDGYLSATNFTTFNNAATDVSNATALSTVSTLVKRDSNGETALDGLTLDGSTSGSIKIQSAASVAVPYTIKMPNAQGAASTFLQNDGSGNLSWAAAGGGLPSQTGNADKVLATDGSSASWQYAGLGAGSLGTNNIVLGKATPITTGVRDIVIGTGTASITSANDSVAIGHNANADAVNSVVIGSGSGAGNYQGESVAIGYAAVGGWYSVVVGSNSNCWTGNNGGQVVVGSSSTAGQFGTTIGGFSTSGGGSIAIGRNVAASGTGSIAIGTDSSTDSIANIMAIGSNGAQINVVYLGKGAADQTTANAVKIMTMKASGPNTDLSAGTLTLAGSQSSGDKAGGDVIIATAPAGSPGTNLNAHVERLRIAATGETRFVGSASGYVGVQSPATVSVPYNLTLPNAQGAASTFLQNDGSGNLSWAAGGSSGANTSLSNLSSVAINTALLGTLGAVGSPAYSFTGDIDTGMWSSGANTLNFSTGGSERLTINSSGNIGIGTTNPSVELEVDSGSAVDILKLVSNAYSYTLSRDNGNGNLKFTGSQTNNVGYTFSSPSGDRLTIAGNGDVTVAQNLTVSTNATISGIAGSGVGPVSGVGLVVSGGTNGDQLRIQQSATHYKIGRESSQGYLQFEGSQPGFIGYQFLENGIDVFRIDINKSVIVNETGADADFRVEGDTDQYLLVTDASADKVGIGTSTPAQKLDVNGTAQATAFKVPNYILSPQLYDEGTETGNFTLNLANGPAQQVTINAAGPLVITLSNPVTGGAYLIKIIQGATPGTVTWPANVLWGAAGAPTLSLATGDIDIINLFYDGTDYYGTYALGF